MGNSWQQLGADLDGEAAGDRSGISVSLSKDGTRLAIGASGNDGNGTDAGHTRVYDWNGTAWRQVGSDIDGEAGGDESGRSVSLYSDGNWLAIGASNNGGTGLRAGHVRVYRWTGTNWQKLGADIDGEAAGDQAGISVSLSDNGRRVALGAYLNDGSGFESGHVRVYQWNGNTRQQVGADIDGEAMGDRSGFFVSLSGSGSRVAIGANGNGGAGSRAGHVRVYEW